MPARKRATSLAHENADSGDVEKLIAGLNEPLKREVLALRKIIRGIDPAIGESVKWNAPSFYTSEHFATFHLRHKGGVQLVLHMGVKPRSDAQARAGIKDPESLLQWKSADRATVTFSNLQDIEARKSAFVNVLRQWMSFV